MQPHRFPIQFWLELGGSTIIDLQSTHRGHLENYSIYIIIVEAPIPYQDPIDNLYRELFRFSWSCISIKPKPILAWHMLWFWALEWGGMIGQNEWFWQTLDIGNMFGPTFGFKIISIQEIKLPKKLQSSLFLSSYIGKNCTTLYISICGRESLKWLVMYVHLYSQMSHDIFVVAQGVFFLLFGQHKLKCIVLNMIKKGGNIGVAMVTCQFKRLLVRVCLQNVLLRIYQSNTERRKHTHTEGNYNTGR